MRQSGRGGGWRRSCQANDDSTSWFAATTRPLTGRCCRDSADALANREGRGGSRGSTRPRGVEWLASALSPRTRATTHDINRSPAPRPFILPRFRFSVHPRPGCDGRGRKEGGGSTGGRVFADYLVRAWALWLRKGGGEGGAGAAAEAHMNIKPCTWRTVATAEEVSPIVQQTQTWTEWHTM